MRLSPPISVLTIVAAAFVVMALFRAGGECVLADDETPSPWKAVIWLSKVVSDHRKPACDILTFAPESHSATAIIFPVRRVRKAENTFVTLDYVYRINADGSASVDLQAMRDPIPLSNLWVGPVRRILSLPSNNARAAAFARLIAIVGPLRTKVSKQPLGANFIERASDGKILGGTESQSQSRGKCDGSFSIPGPDIRLQFFDGEEKYALGVGRSFLCSDRARQAAAERIAIARELTFNALSFRPPGAVFYSR